MTVETKRVFAGAVLKVAEQAKKYSKLKGNNTYFIPILSFRYSFLIPRLDRVQKANIF
jgi:hypothetical protein